MCIGLLSPKYSLRSSAMSRATGSPFCIRLSSFFETVSPSGSWITTKDNMVMVHMVNAARRSRLTM